MKIGNLIILGLTLFFSSGLFAQKWQFGPDLGGNLMAVETDAFGNDFKPQFHVGGFVSYYFTSTFSLRSGAYFSQKTHTYHQSDTSKLNLFGFEDQLPDGVNADLNIYTNIKGRTTQYYVELPLLAVYSYDRFSAFLGPYIGYMVFARSKTETVTEVPFLQALDIASLDPSGTLTAFLPDPYTYEFRTSNSTKNLNNWDLGIRGGIGIDYDKIGLQIFYNYGLLDYRSNTQSVNNKPYNYFQATMNYSFSCKGKK